MDIRRRIRDALVMRGKTMNQLYLRLGVPKSSASNWLSGKRNMSIDMLVSIAEYCGCSVDYLLGRTDSPDPWSAIAMDELNLSSQAVETLHGNAPHEHQLLSEVQESNNEAEIEHAIHSLDVRRESIHDAVAALLSSEYFEQATLILECACRFNYDVTAGNNPSGSTKQRRFVAYDEISDLGDGRYAVPLNDIVKYRKNSVLEILSKAIDDAIKAYTAKHMKHMIEEIANSYNETDMEE